MSVLRLGDLLCSTIGVDICDDLHAQEAVDGVDDKPLGPVSLTQTQFLLLCVSVKHYCSIFFDFKVHIGFQHVYILNKMDTCALVRTGCRRCG